MKKTILTALVMIMALIGNSQTLKFHDLIDTYPTYDSTVVNYLTIDIKGDTAFVSYSVSVYHPIKEVDVFGLYKTVDYKEEEIHRVNQMFKVLTNEKLIIHLYRMNMGIIPEHIEINYNYLDNGSLAYGSYIDIHVKDLIILCKF